MDTSSIQFYPVARGLAVAVLLLGGCADQTVEISRSVAWADDAVQADNLFIAGQPDLQRLAAARDAGIEMVINLRLPGEIDWDEAAAVEELGLQYLNIPISRSGPGFDAATIESLHEIANNNPDKKILMHCSTGNRVSAWYALYLVEEKGYWLEEALPVAEQTGLTNDELVARVRDYLSAR